MFSWGGWTLVEAACSADALCGFPLERSLWYLGGRRKRPPSVFALDLRLLNVGEGTWRDGARSRASRGVHQYMSRLPSQGEECQCGQFEAEQ